MLAKFFAFLLLFAVIGSLYAAAVDVGNANEADTTERKCVMGAHYYNGCNWCVCHQGNAISCTLKYCQVYNPKTATFEAAKEVPAPEDFWEKSSLN